MITDLDIEASERCETQGNITSVVKRAQISGLSNRTLQGVNLTEVDRYTFWTKQNKLKQSIFVRRCSVVTVLAVSTYISTNFSYRTTDAKCRTFHER